MQVKLDEIITWLIVGALVGWLTGMLIKRRKQGFGHFVNLGIGLVGALLGGFLFKVLNINLGLLSDITISLQQVVAGLVGSLIFLAAIWGVRKKWPGKTVKDGDSLSTAGRK